MRSYKILTPVTGLVLIASLLPGCIVKKEGAVNGLPSWNEGPAKTAIIEFVEAVTGRGNPEYVQPSDRIAVFDNDGTLWPEQPVNFQLIYVIERVKKMAPQNPEWAEKQPFNAVLDNDWETLVRFGEEGLTELLATANAGMTTEEFDETVKQWLATARHPRYDLPFTDLVYQPMLELLNYLKNHDFKIYIVSDGGVEFMRLWAEDVYGIPPEQVIGSSIITEFEIRDGKPVLLREPEMDFVNNGAARPAGIYKFIGRRPLAAFGNSDGDLQMLQWTAGGEGPRLMMLIHHTDGVREWAYDRKSYIGRLDRALIEADERGWTVVDMKKDWKVVFPFDTELGRSE